MKNEAIDVSSHTSPLGTFTGFEHEASAASSQTMIRISGGKDERRTMVGRGLGADDELADWKEGIDI
ncbi:hypothetical protein Daesc_005893 [Daldinia eschscholtzii]|uniref:Uncharacterized protein n=1 Tax=Daldinia eschscholtzii TaxID=292717 RepID=A0AAX6MLS0_9PEZI